MNEAAAIAAGAPAGFRLIAFEGVTFNAMIGPLYISRESGDVVLGFRVEQRHCNPGGILHGGMTFDFVAAGNVGDWIEGRSEILRITRSLAFTSVDLSAVAADGERRRVLRASCIMKIPSGEGIRFDRAKLIG